MDVKIVAAFGVGVLVGGIVVKVIDSNKLDRFNRFEQEVQKLAKRKETEYIEVHKEADKIDISGDSVPCEGISGQSSDSTRSEFDKERVSEFLRNSEYVDASSADSEDTAVEAGDVTHLMKETKVWGLAPDGTIDIINLNSPTSEPEVDDTMFGAVLSIRQIDAIDFVKAVTSGKTMRSFIFDPSKKKLYWNFTDEPLEDGDIRTLIGDEIYQQIMAESCEPSNYTGQIHIRYLYDPIEDVYSKIENGTVI